jgi:hypothetical protein
MAFENIVQPFESFDVTYPRRIIKVDEAPPDNVVLKIGDSGGSVKTLGYSRSYSLTTYMNKVQKEEAGPQSTVNETVYQDARTYNNGVVPGVAVPVGGLAK